MAETDKAPETAKPDDSEARVKAANADLQAVMTRHRCFLTIRYTEGNVDGVPYFRPAVSLEAIR